VKRLGYSLSQGDEAFSFGDFNAVVLFLGIALAALSGARDEVLLTATAQNLRRLAKLLCRAPPPVAAAA
jgi:hypothetical protein